MSSVAVCSLAHAGLGLGAASATAARESSATTVSVLLQSESAGRNGREGTDILVARP